MASRRGESTAAGEPNVILVGVQSHPVVDGKLALKVETQQARSRPARAVDGWAGDARLDGVFRAARSRPAEG